MGQVRSPLSPCQRPEPRCLVLTPRACSSHTGRACIRPHVRPATAEPRLQSCRSRASAQLSTGLCLLRLWGGTPLVWSQVTPGPPPAWVPSPWSDLPSTAIPHPGVVTGDTGGPRPAWTPLPVVRPPSPAVPSGTLAAFLGPSLWAQASRDRPLLVLAPWGHSLSRVEGWRPHCLAFWCPPAPLPPRCQ